MATQPVVVITGASKGIGLAVAKLLLDTFAAKVAGISRSKSPEVQQLLTAHPGTFLHVECDITDAAALENAISTTLKTFAHIDSLILNAGVLEPTGPISSPALTVDAWKAHFDVNVFSLITALRATLPSLRTSSPGGRVIFVSSGSATGNTYGWAPYNASKAAVNSLCRTLAQEEPDVVCVAVRPGKVDTAMQAQIRSSEGKMLPEDISKYVKEFKEGKLVDPSECGYVIAGLALRAPKELTGKFVSWDSEECRDFWDDQ